MEPCTLCCQPRRVLAQDMPSMQRAHVELAPSDGHFKMATI